MTSLTFEHIHEAVAEAFPELARPLALLCDDEIFSTNGVPRQYSGTSMLLRSFLEVLVALPVSPHRNAALHRAFAFIERMLASPDHDLVGLAEIELIEGQPAWWYQRALPFAGPLYQQAAGRVSDGLWTQATAPGAPLQFPELDPARPVRGAARDRVHAGPGRLDPQGHPGPGAGMMGAPQAAHCLSAAQ